MNYLQGLLSVLCLLAVLVTVVSTMEPPEYMYCVTNKQCIGDHKYCEIPRGKIRGLCKYTDRIVDKEYHCQENYHCYQPPCDCNWPEGEPIGTCSCEQDQPGLPFIPPTTPTTPTVE